MKTFTLIVMLASCAFSGAEVYEQRQENQQNRIEQGVTNGSLTDGEAARAAAGQKRIEKAEDRMEADGKVTNREKAKLDRMQDRESRKIKRMKHNRRS